MTALIRTGDANPILGARDESRVGLAGVLAIIVHAVALVALTYGFHIQRERTAPVVAELWSTLPPSPAADPARPSNPQPAPQPAPKPAPKPPPEPPPKPASKPLPPEPKAPPAKVPPKADIEMKAKEAKEARQAKEVQAAKQAEDDRRRLDEAKKREKELASEKLSTQKEEQAKSAEADRLRREQDDLSRKAAEAAVSAQARLLASYVDKIRAKVRRFIVEPPGVTPTATAEFDVVLIPGGDVLSVKLRRSSGNTLYDEAVERAIRRAEPLPIPPEPQLFPQFRELRLQIRPQD